MTDTMINTGETGSAPSILAIRGLQKSFGSLSVLKDISLSVERGNVVSIIGPSGSGKSTLLRIATFLETGAGGDILYDGQYAMHNGVYVSKKELNTFRTRFGLVFQNFNLFPHYSVLKNITEAPILHGENKEAARERGMELLKKMGLEGKENAYIYMGDRWNSGNVASSKYVWLPLSVRSGYPAVRWYDAWDLSVFEDMYRYKRAKNITDDGEYLLIERRSDRVLSRKNSFTLENDDTTQNVVWNIIKTDNPYEFKLRQVSSGKFLESVFGTMRLQSESDRTAQRWRFVLQEDGYYRIENAEDGKCFTVSGSSTYAGTTVFLNDPDLKNFRSPAHQLFAVYFDSYKHPEYEEAELFSREYREENRRKIEEFELAMSVEAPTVSTMEGQRHDPTVVYDIYGRRIADSLSQPLKQGIYIVGGRKYFK